MHNIEFKIDNRGRGAFYIEEGLERVAEMEVGIQDGNLTVYHTEVAEKLQGKGIAAKLLSAMVTYAEERRLKVIPLCSYVLTQFKRNPSMYESIWNNSSSG